MSVMPRREQVAASLPFVWLMAPVRESQAPPDRTPGRRHVRSQVKTSECSGRVADHGSVLAPGAKGRSSLVPSIESPAICRLTDVGEPPRPAR